jgi:hypothetical protein
MMEILANSEAVKGKKRMLRTMLANAGLSG